MNECNSIETIDRTNLTEQTRFRLDKICNIENLFTEEKYYWSTSWDSKCRSYFIFSLTTGIVKKILNITRNKNKNHDKVLMLAKTKLNSMETLVSQALIDMEISHEEFITILQEKKKCEKMKDNLSSENGKYEIMRLIRVKSTTYVKNY